MNNEEGFSVAHEIQGSEIKIKSCAHGHPFDEQCLQCDGYIASQPFNVIGTFAADGRFYPGKVIGNQIKNNLASDLLTKASELLSERGKQYDKPDGERSMRSTVDAFNAITGHKLSEYEGWLLMCLLKMVRQAQNPEKLHADSLQDGIAYAALMAEAKMREGE